MISLDNLKTTLNAIKCLLNDYAKKKDVPTKLPNPKRLNFTGAVKRSYDGSKALTVEIPYSVQSDWNQNDSTELNYIKNRPFYTGEPVETVLVEETTVSFTNSSANIYYGAIPATIELIAGETYKVSWDGATYECVCELIMGHTALGNPSIMGAGADTGVPFLIMPLADNQSTEIYTLDTSASHTISISGFIAQNVQIPDKYISDTFRDIIIAGDPLQWSDDDWDKYYALFLSGKLLQIITDTNSTTRGYVSSMFYNANPKIHRISFIDANGNLYSLMHNNAAGELYWKPLLNSNGDIYLRYIQDSTDSTPKYATLGSDGTVLTFKTNDTDETPVARQVVLEGDNVSAFTNDAGYLTSHQDISGKQDKSTLEADVSAAGFTKNTGTYSKPTDGIPKTDLANDVQASLAKADTALQEHQSLAAYRTAEEQNIIDNGKQDKLIAGENIAIAADGKTISATGGGGTVPKPLTYDYMPEGYPTKAMGTVTVMEEQELAFLASEFYDSNYVSFIPTPLDIAEGQTYTVNWDGTEYECVGFYFNGEGIFLGNISVLGVGDDTGEPFLYGYNSHESENIFITPDTSPRHTISVKGIDEVAIPMSEEFIPTTAKLPNPNPLTFTGAVTGSYDGSEALTVEIPFGSDFETVESQLVDIPSKLSQFTNDAGYLTLDTLPKYDGSVT